MFEQPANIPDIFVTLPVLKLPIGRLDRLLHPLNMSRILITLPVSKLLRFTLSKAVQFPNIPDISLTFLV